MITVLHAPMHATDGDEKFRRAKNRAIRTGAWTIGFTECVRSHEVMHQRGFRTVTGKGGNPRTWNDCLIMTKNKMPNLGSFTIKVCEGASPEKLAPPRAFAGSLFNHPMGDFLHLCVHPHARPRGPNFDWSPDKVGKRCYEYMNSMMWMEDLIKFYQRQKFKIIVTGDMNYPDNKDNWPWNPFNVFQRCQLKWWNQHIDAIAWSREFDLARKPDVIENAPGTDHPWIKATIK